MKVGLAKALGMGTFTPMGFSLADAAEHVLPIELHTRQCGRCPGGCPQELTGLPFNTRHIVLNALVSSVVEFRKVFWRRWDLRWVLKNEQDSSRKK